MADLAPKARKQPRLTTKMYRSPRTKDSTVYYAFCRSAWHESSTMRIWWSEHQQKSCLIINSHSDSKLIDLISPWCLCVIFHHYQACTHNWMQFGYIFLQMKRSIKRRKPQPPSTLLRRNSAGERCCNPEMKGFGFGFLHLYVASGPRAYCAFGFRVVVGWIAWIPCFLTFKKWLEWL